MRSRDAQIEDLRRERRWLIATGVPLAAAHFAFGLSNTGWLSVVCIVCGTYIATRVLDLIAEPIA